MKPLDSLALMLALSTATTKTPSFKDSIRQRLQLPELQTNLPAIDTTTGKEQPNTTVIIPAIKAEKGTFSASEIYWSNENNEVYFKGTVRVDFQKQHFSGKGEFTFLGKVYLLSVDDVLMEIGKSTKLSKEKYQLSVLNSKEAMEKYGEGGKNGAVLIYKSK